MSPGKHITKNEVLDKFKHVEFFDVLVRDTPNRKKKVIGSLYSYLSRYEMDHGGISRL